MKTQAKQTGKLNGTSSMMVLGILFLTALPLNSVLAGNNEKSDNYEVTDKDTLIEPYLPIETWMLSLTEWNTENLVAQTKDALVVEDWMLAPENWNNNFQTEFAEAPEADLKPIDDWMFEPAGWRSDFARLGQDIADRDLVLIPLYF